MEITRFVGRELGSLLLGDLFARGSARDVYTTPLDDAWVVKVETTAGSFQNVIEWETWREVQETPFSIYFAPCLHISKCGGVLIQRKTQAVGLSQLPKRMPAFLCDFKRSNYGLLDGRIVCHDYGLQFAIHSGLTRRQRTVKWVDE